MGNQGYHLNIMGESFSHCKTFKALHNQIYVLINFYYLFVPLKF